MASCQPYNQDWQTSSGQEMVEGDGDVLECGEHPNSSQPGFSEGSWEIFRRA